MEEMSKNFMEMMQAAAAQGPTLDEVKAVPTPHGRLVGCSYYASSCGMAFNSNTLLDISAVLIDGVQKISYTQKEAFQPTVATVYIPKQDVFSALQELVERENLAAWSALEYHDPFKCTDYSSSASISLNYDDSSIGGRKSVRVVINVNAACQHGGGDVIQQFRNILEMAVQDAEVVSRTESGSSMFGLGMMGMLASPPQSPSEPVQEIKLPDGAWKCGKCGFEANTGKFCTECGAKREV